MNGTLVDQTDCLRAPYDTANAVLLCAFSGSSSPCGGDSGSGLVLMTPLPVLVGVTRAASCTSNSAASFADLTAPEILQFVQGNDDPPAAPRPTAPPMIERPTPVPQVGQTISCTPGTWTGSPSFAYSLYEGVNHQLLRSGPTPDHVLRDADAGRTLLCRVTATNAGGTGFDESATTPRSSERTRGDRAGDGGAARDDGCRARAPRRLGAADRSRHDLREARAEDRRQACRAATPAGASLAGVADVRVKGTSPLVRARLLVTAQAADGRAAARGRVPHRRRLSSAGSPADARFMVCRMAEVAIRRDGPVLWITLNRPDRSTR